MLNCIERLKEEVEQTKSLINYYVSSGNPSIEIIEPNQFRKLEELDLALKIIEKYSVR